MNNQHRKILHSHTVYINKNLIAKGEFLDYLFENGTLTRDMVEEIEAATTTHQKASKFSETIVKRGPDAFQMFLEALIESGQVHIANKLDHRFTDLYKSRAQKLQQEELENYNGSGKKELAPCKIDKALPIETTPNSEPNYFAAYSKDISIGKEEGEIECGSADLEVKITNVDETDSDIQTLLMDTENVYRMNSKPRGVAVIFSNETFLTKYRPRKGNQFDLTNLKSLFSDLGFVVKEHADKKAMQMRELIQQERHDVIHKSSSAFIFCCLSHGAKGKIYGIDAEGLDIQTEIIDPFDGNNCEHLRGKPKVVIFQACQGRESTQGVLRHDGPLDEMSEVDAVSAALNTLELGDQNIFVPSLSNIHEKADIFQMYATSEGYKAWRHPEIGSWFVRAIVLVFQEYCHKEHLLDLFQRVAQRVSQLQTGYSFQKGEGYFVQQPYFKGSMTKRLFFFPGYYDIQHDD